MSVLTYTASAQCDPISNSISEPTVACPSNDPGIIENVDGPTGDCNILTNHEFDNGTADWVLLNQSGASSTLTIDTNSELSGTNSAYVNQISATGTFFHTSVRQAPFSLTAGTLYNFSFEAKAESNRTIQVRLQLRQSPWTTYWNQVINLTTTAQTFTFTDIDPNITHANIGLMIRSGNATPNYWFDNVVFEEASCNTAASGYDYEWEYSDDAGTTWTVIAGATDLEYDPPVITADRLYRRNIKEIGCTTWYTSNEVEADLCIPNDPCEGITPGSIIEPTVACPSNEPGEILSGNPVSNNCNELENGEFDDGLTNWADGTGASLSVDNTGLLSGPNSGFVNISSSGGYINNSSYEYVSGEEVEVSFEAYAASNKSITAVIKQNHSPWSTLWSQSLNLTTTPQTFTFSNIDLGATDNNIRVEFWTGNTTNFWLDNVQYIRDCAVTTVSYMWQFRVSDGAGGWTTWTDISGATAETYQPPTVTEEIQYRRLSMVGLCTTWFDTDPVTLSLCDNCDLTANPLDNEILQPTVACPGNDPSLIEDVLSPGTSTFVTYEYVWEQSTNGGTSWTVIAGATGLEYDPPVIANGMLFRRKIRVVGCTDWSISNVVEASVCIDPCDTATNPIANEIGGGVVACPEYDPALILDIASPVSTSAVTYEYEWEVSSDGGVTWTVISGATGVEYDPPSITVDQYYRRKVRGVGCTTWDISNEIEALRCVIPEVCDNGIDDDLDGDIDCEDEDCGQIINREFDLGQNPWRRQNSNGVSTSYTIDNTGQLSGTNSAFVETNNATGSYWHSQLYQTGLSVESGKIYEISFSAKSVGTNKQVRVILQNSQSPWNEYFSQLITVTTTEQEFVFTYPTTSTNIGNVRLSFGLGIDDVDLYLDKVQYKEGCVELIAYNSGEVCVGAFADLLSIIPQDAVSYTWTGPSGFASTDPHPSFLISSAAQAGTYTLTVNFANGTVDSESTTLIVDSDCSDICLQQVPIFPTNPSSCNGTDGKIYVTDWGANVYEHTIDGINWFPTQHTHENLSAGVYLVSIRENGDNYLCRTATIILESNPSPWYTGESVTGTSGCLDEDGTITLQGVLTTDMVSWIATDGQDNFVNVGSLSPTNTITGLRAGQYYVKVQRGNSEYCYTERIVEVPNDGLACPDLAVCDEGSTNFFPGGDFGSGSFPNGPPLAVTETGYSYATMNCGSPNDGFYSIVNHTACNGVGSGGQVFSTWDVLNEDHTLGDSGGYMLLVNASFKKDIAIERQVTGLMPNSYYTFSAWVYNIYPWGPLKPNLTFLVDGVGEYSTGTISGSGWQKVGFPFFTGSKTSVSLAIRNNQTGGDGNDWIIDDISVTNCNPEIIITGDEGCEGEIMTLTAEVQDAAEQFDYFIWQEFNSTTNQWEDVTGAANGTYNQTVMTVEYVVTTSATTNMNGNLFRLLVSNSLAGFSNPNLVTISDEVLLTVHPAPEVTTSSSGILNCDVTEVNLEVTPSGLSYEWSGPNGFMSTLESPLVSEPGSYTVTATTANGCASVDTTIVEQDIGADIEVLDQVLCAGDSVTLSAIVDSTVVSITWDNGAGTGDSVIVWPTETTTYTATAVFENGCEATADAIVTVLSGVDVNLGDDLTICEGEDVLLTAMTTGGVGELSYQWSANLPGVTTDTVTVLPLTSTTYSVTVTDDNGCSGVDEMSISLMPTPTLVLEDIDMCIGAPDVFIIPDITEGTEPYAYHWLFPDGTTTPQTQVQVYPATPAGTYTLTVTDANGCVAIDSMDLQIFDPSVEVTVVNVVCAGDDDGSIEAIALGSGPFSYTLSGQGTNSTGIFTGLSGGQYVLDVVDSEGCEISTGVNITQPAPLICSQDSCVRSYTSIWSGTEPWTAPGVELSILHDTNTEIKSSSLTETLSTTDPGWFTESVSGLPSLEFSFAWDDTPDLIFGNIDLPTDDKGTAIFTFTFDDPVKDIVLHVDKVGGNGGFPGFYKSNSSEWTVTTPGVILQKLSGTQDLNVETGRFYKTPNLLIGPGQESSELAEDGTAAGSIALLSATPLTSVSFSVTGIGIEGIGSDLVEMAISSTVCHDVEPKDYNCDASPGVATISGCGGQPPYTYAWDNGETTQTATNLTEGTHTVVITDASGCDVTCSVEIGASILELSAGPIVTFCEGESAVLVPLALSENHPLIFNWTGPNGFTFDNVNPLVSEAGTYYLEVTDAIGCSATDSVEVHVFLCDQTTDCYFLDEFNADTYWGSDGTLDWTGVSWDESFDDNSSFSGDVMVLGGVLMMEHSDASPPSIQRKIDLTGHSSAILSFDFWAGGNLDSGDEFIVEVFDGTTWTTIFTVQGPLVGAHMPWLDLSPYISSDTEIRFTIVSGFDEPGDKLILDNIRVDADCLCEGIADAGIDVSICEGDSIQLMGMGGVAFEWSPVTDLSDSTISDPYAFPTQTTTYTLTVTDENGCTDSDEVVVTVNGGVDASAVAISQDSCQDGSGEATVTITAGQGPFTITWQNSSGGESGSDTINDIGDYTITDLNGGTTYCIQVTDANGCEVNTP